ncbi:unnamed protein product [Tuber melanosporum]|uniref:(Perigord truffle) hypothetical protein n=1 Tax=Tuber melanosporum (strain Mel28) TaxID=656061 RepID=D5GDR7_TUBMM|nr:uncharacterized protein GSTUM_00006240001 [Tuber melanosporum]CAZ82660.1 unnamed protein product [Tuber melanosporum]
MIPTMLRNVRLRGYIADAKLPPRPSDLQQDRNFPNSTSKDFWTRPLDKPSLEVSINIASLQLIVAAGLYVMPSILRSSTDVNAGADRMAADPNSPRGRRLRISEPLRLQGLSHSTKPQHFPLTFTDRSTREDIIMFFQQIPEGMIRHADFHEYYPKYDGLSRSKRMWKFEALWESCTIWLPQYGAYILNPACLPGKDASMFTPPSPPHFSGNSLLLN